MRTFGNGNKGRSGPNAGKGRPQGNRFSGGRKPSPAGDGTGFKKRDGGGKSDGDASHPRSFGRGNTGRGEDRPFNRSYSKPYDSSSRPFSKTDNSGESKEDSGDRSFRGRSERPSGGSSSRPYGRSERPSGDSNERPYRGRPERTGSGSSDRSFGRSERPSRDSNERPYRGHTEQSESGESDRPFGRTEKPSREPKERPNRGHTERSSGDSGDRPFKRSERSFRDPVEKTRRNRIEKPTDGSSDSPYKSERPSRESSERPYHKPSTERDGKSKPFDRPHRNTSERPKRQSDTDKLEPYDDTKEMRINKYISNCGYCSRREADTLIAAGAVKVNGVVVAELGSKVLPTDKVQIGEVTLSREATRYILLNKPKGYITTSDDPYDRKTVMSLVTNACRERIYPVGRLDRNTSGLLLFTNDGDLAKKLTHPKYGVRKVYHVGLDKALTKNDMLSIGEGITLDEGPVAIDEIAYVNDDKKEIGIELHSGQNRVVRRIFESLGYEVVKLDRVIFANLTKKDLARGRWRLLEPHELNTLKMLL